ncbi:MAG: beta-ketoacyl-ACP synthase II [Pseudomonadota bacterium]|jgi:3-oxoacyl-[acyl-carrier-protein] synthase II|nr:beta-ketoacyl-ACP synthase II [Alphaproteobacteria bacterium]
MRRVVVTGVGAITPLANGAALTWERLIASQSGIGTIEAFDVSDLAAKIAGMVPLQLADTPKQPGLFDASDYLEPKEQRKIDRFILYAIAAADEAVKDSGWQPTNQEDRERTGVTIGAGIGGLSWIYDTSVTLLQQGARRVSPFFIPASLINLAAGQVSIRHGFQGPNHAVVTACATGAHSIGDAARMIMLDDADVMIAGGAEAAVCRAGVAGFAAARALSTSFNDSPTKASRPWDKDRDGFVMGEGSGIVVLEEYEHAKKRGAKIYAEVLGYGMSGDAHHITSPAEDGGGAYRAMRAALKNSKLSLEDIGYINAHGTSTPAGDAIEVTAMKRLFGDHAKNLAISSTKSAIGHLLGAAGAVESIFSIFAMQDGIVPPTLNLDNPSEGCDLNLVPHKAQEKNLDYVMSNSFGFGGTNASLIFGRAP